MDILTKLRDSLGESLVLTGQDVTDRIPHVWRVKESIHARAICTPVSTEQVAKICKICHECGQSIVVHGGLTNLVRSTESCPEDVVISMERMNRILDIDVFNRSMIVEAGAILETVQKEALDRDLFFPLNFGARGSCQIGGCISTNAGGLRVIKYGMTRNMILGIEAVLANGTIVSSMNKMIKNNSGYDLKQLFIGSEGTLGIVTRAVLRLQERPVTRYSAFTAHKDFRGVVKMLKHIDKHMAGNLSAFEVFWPSAYVALTSPESQYKPPLPYGSAFYVLCEVLGGDISTDIERFQNALEKAWSEEICVDAVIASNESDLQWFWNIREDVGNIVALCPHRQDFDVSLSIGHMDDYIKEVQEALSGEPKIIHCFVFGHMADGNLHLIIGKKDDSPSLTQWINESVYTPLRQFEGSVSAEHGIGLDKKAYLSLSRGQDEIELMKTLKRTLDKKNILNPGKIF